MRAFSCGLVAAGLTLVFCLLQPAGSQALAADDFKPEEGFTLLFNGKDLSGWQTKQGESLEGKTEAFKNRFTAADGNLVIDDKVKGDVIIQTTRQFAKDVTIKFDFKPGPGCNNDLYLRGIKFDIKKESVKNLKEGEWNEFEFVVTGEKAEIKINGQVQQSAGAKPAATPFGMRAEFGSIQYRRIRSKEG